MRVEEKDNNQKPIQNLPGQYAMTIYALEFRIMNN